MIIFKILIAICSVVVAFGFWCCFRVKAYYNTPEDYDYYNNLSIKNITKNHEKYKLSAVINDGKLIGFIEE